jgi:hypothetical protein
MDTFLVSLHFQTAKKANLMPSSLILILPVE